MLNALAAFKNQVKLFFIQTKGWFLLQKRFHKKQEVYETALPIMVNKM